MQEKIYSRRRIRLFRINKVLFIIICLIILIILVFMSAYPIFVASCRTAAGSKATNIVTDEVKNVMVNYSYNDLIDVEKDEDGNIVLVKSNTLLITRIMSEITKNIQVAIDNTPTITVYMNSGSVSGLSFLKRWGPRLNIELEAAGKIDTEIISEFESVGVNQTIHKIYLNLSTNVNILTPVGVYDRDFASKVLLTEAIIVGEVPSTYYNLEGIKESDIFSTVE